MTEETINRHSFILRIWREGENQEWKSSVQHVNNGESVLLGSLEELSAFIAKYTNQEGIPFPGRPIKTKKKSGLK